MSHLRRVGAVIALVAISGLGLSACGAAETTFTLTQSAEDEVQLTPLNLNPDGDAGDVTAFDVPVRKDGELYGAVMGTMTKVGSIGDGWNTEREERMYTAVFDLPQGQISVLGISYYREGDTLLPAGEPVTRAIVGGTGEYVGVDGDITTVRNADGSYTHTVRIIG